MLLNGDAVTGATTYTLYWSTSPGVNTTNGNKLPAASAPLAHTALLNGQTYYYVVTASNAGGESAASAEAHATPMAAAVSADPLFIDQWHLLNTSQVAATGVLAKGGEDINVSPVWNAGNKGAGVHIAIVDEDLEMAHEDIVGNLAGNALNYNYLTGANDPTADAADISAGHGTAVAGLVAARDQNGLGGSGVAPRATLHGYALLNSPTDLNKADAMTRNSANVDIFNNSWGPADGTGNIMPSSSLWRTSIETGLATGRAGRGTIYVWSAGNGAKGSTNCISCFDNSNYDGYANYRGVIAVAAVNDQGTWASYSEQGANLWVSAPGGDASCNTHALTTTDRTAELGLNTDGVGDYLNTHYTKCMNGTSAAAPIVSGVVALMLAANPNLSWRDVRLILAQTARMNDAGTCLDASNPCVATSTGWQLNGGTPQYYFSHDYGFGVVDATAAVTAAQSWVNVGAEKSHTTPIATPKLAIPDNDATGVAHTIAVAASGINSIEWVEITLSAADHTFTGELNITLTSPSGSVSQLARRHSCKSALCAPYINWVFGSAAHLGEVADGNWTLTVKDQGANDVGTFQSWKLKFYGH